MKITKSVEAQSDTKWALKVNKNIYRQFQAGKIWNTLLVETLTSSAFGFRQSKIDKCVFYHGKIMHIPYTDDSILEGSNEEELRKNVADIKAAELDID